VQRNAANADELMMGEGMNNGFPRLLGDIGGTNARWAWHAAPGEALTDVTVWPCADHATLADSAAAYLASRGGDRPVSASIGIATAVTGDEVRMTNHHWRFSIAELKRQLGVERCLVINDFTALAMSLTALGADDLRTVGGGPGVPGQPVALLGPGTGLGVSGLLPAAGGGWSPLSGEGGHVTLAAADSLESEVLTLLRSRHGHVSAERVLSGSGLVNLVEALAALEGESAPDLQPADVSRAAVDRSDPRCVRAARLFASFLGNVAGNLALTLGARGGVYVGGGIVPKLGDAFDVEVFRRRFEDKGRFSAYLQPVPTWIIVATTPALIGATRALDLMPA
jgi:glucokinase